MVLDPAISEFGLPLKQEKCAKLDDGSLASIKWEDGTYAYKPVEDVLEQEDRLAENLLVFGVSLPGRTPENLSGGPFHSVWAHAAIQALGRAGHEDVVADIARQEAALKERCRLEAIQREERERLAREERALQKKRDALKQLMPLFQRVRTATGQYDAIRPSSFTTDEGTSRLIFLSLIMADAAGLSPEEVQFLSGGRTPDELKWYMRPNESWEVSGET